MDTSSNPWDEPPPPPHPAAGPSAAAAARSDRSNSPSTVRGGPETDDEIPTGWGSRDFTTELPEEAMAKARATFLALFQEREQRLRVGGHRETNDAYLRWRLNRPPYRVPPKTRPAEINNEGGPVPSKAVPQQGLARPIETYLPKQTPVPNIAPDLQ